MALNAWQDPGNPSQGQGGPSQDFQHRRNSWEGHNQNPQRNTQSKGSKGQGKGKGSGAGKGVGQKGGGK